MKKTSKKSASVGNKKTALAVAIVLVILISGAGAYYTLRTDPKVANVMNLGQQLRDENTPREQRRELWGQMREAMEDLSPEQRAQVDREMRRERGDRRPPWEPDYNKFFAMTPKEQTKFLDQQIDEMVKRRKEWEKRREAERKERAQNGQGGTGAQGGQGGPGGQGGQGGGPGGRGGNGGPGGGGGDRSQQRRLSLDSGSAMQRAQSNDYRRAMATRMQQRGIPMTGGPGGGGPGGRRGP